ncbi:phosphatase phospho-type [Chlamydoabsidia padenii]|nr:phosphatase phospho-type [Chlamydoabsidia padenii]
MGPARNLAVFDFDWSLIEQDSDCWTIANLSEEVLNKYINQTGSQWTDVVDQAVCELQDKGFTLDQFKQVLQTIPFTTAMMDALKLLKEHGTKVLILSDANSFYIDTILKAHGVYDLVDDVITNPAYFDEKNRLRVNRRILASSTPHQCPYSCAVNMCKGQELTAYIKEHGPFQKIMYVGDGKNDYCPATHLGQDDRMFVRSDKSLARYLEDESVAANIKANITYWNSSNVVKHAIDVECL